MTVACQFVAAATGAGSAGQRVLAAEPDFTLVSWMRLGLETSRLRVRRRRVRHGGAAALESLNEGQSRPSGESALCGWSLAAALS